MKTGYVVFAHGSSVETANDSVREAARRFQEITGYELVQPAFLEQGRPPLHEAVAQLVGRGAGRVAVIPYFLTLGAHLQRDLPRIVEEISRIHEDLEIVVTRPLEGHPSLAAILADRAREAGPT